MPFAMTKKPKVANHRLPKVAERSGAAFGSPSEFTLLDTVFTQPAFYVLM